MKKILMILILLCQGCSTDISNVKWWVGDSTRGSIVRKKGAVKIQCNEPLFDKYFCVVKEDFEKVVLKLYQCKKKGAK